MQITQGIQASAATAVVLAGGSLIRPVPWPLWALWAGLTVLAVVDARQEA
jgi:hypothetical protein